MQTQFLDLYRAGVRSAVDVMNASLASTVRLQQQQLEMVRNTLEENSRATGAQLDRMTEFWTGLWRTAGDAQKSMIDRMQEQMDQSAEVVRESHAFAERASEDATELAASQVASAVGQVREAASHQQRRRSA